MASINPEYEKLLPKLSSEEFEALKKSIREEGLHYPIIVNQDKIVLDGHHRLRVCKELGIEPRFEVWRSFEANPLLERKFVIEVNLRRRHLSEFQRAELAYPLLEIENELAKQRQLATLKQGDHVPLGSNEPIGEKILNLRIL